MVAQSIQSAKILMLPVTISPLHFKSHFLYHAIEKNSQNILKLQIMYAKLCENKEKVINMSFHSVTLSGSNKIILLFSPAGCLLLSPGLTF